MRKVADLQDYVFMPGHCLNNDASLLECPEN